MRPGNPARAAATVALSIALTGCITTDTSNGKTPRPPVTSPEPIPWSTTAPGKPIGTAPAPAVTPLEGQPLTVTLLIPKAVTPGKRYRFTVRLANTGARPISLHPCPSYRVQMAKLVESGYLNCAGAPDVIPPGTHLDFAMQIGTRSSPYGPAADLTWHLGSEGTEGVGATVRVPINES
ncbi:hypothetical protein [Streptomyces sp. NPDC019507]|uniref:hypothetical protein n=1 Tax=Streptomyces sp. NPDC019507 TaxID=3154689 RepID=UPI0033E997D8